MESQVCPVCQQNAQRFICKICIHDRVSGRLVRYRHVKTEREAKAQLLQDAISVPSLYTFLATRDTTLRRIFFLEEYVRQIRFQLKFERSKLEQRELALKHRRDALIQRTKQQRQAWKQCIPSKIKDEKALASIWERRSKKRAHMLVWLGKEMGISRGGMIRNLQIARPAEMSTADRKMLNSALGYVVQFVNAAARYAGEILPHRLLYNGSTSYAQTTYATPASIIPSQLPLYLAEDHREIFVFSYALLLFNILHLIKALHYPLPRIAGNANLLIESINVLTRQPNRPLRGFHLMQGKPSQPETVIDFGLLLSDMKQFFYNEPSYYESDVGGFNLINAPGWSLPVHGQPTTSATAETVTVPRKGRADVVNQSPQRQSANVPLIPIASWWQYQPSFHESVFFQDQTDLDRSVAPGASAYSSFINVPSQIVASTATIGPSQTASMALGRSSASPSGATEKSGNSNASDEPRPEPEILAMRLGGRSNSPGLAGLASLVNASSSAETIGIRGRKQRYLRRQLVPTSRDSRVTSSPAASSPGGALPPLRSSRAQSGSQVSSPDESDWHMLDQSTRIPHSTAYGRESAAARSSNIYRKSSAAVSTVWNSHVMGILTPIGRVVQKHTPPVLTNAVQYGKNFVTSALPPDDTSNASPGRQ